MSDKMSFEDRTKLEYERGRQKAAENAERLAKAEAARKAEAEESERLADPEGYAARKADEEAANQAAAEAKPMGGVFPHATEPVQPGAEPVVPPPPPPSPDPGTPDPEKTE